MERLTAVQRTVDAALAALARAQESARKTKVNAS